MRFLWPYCEVDIDTDILQTAICIGVKIHHSVIIRVKAIPSNEPFHVKQEWIDTKDNQWMGQAKERIEKEGREKEVTLHGRTWYKELMTRPSNTSDKVNAKCEYRCHMRMGPHINQAPPGPKILKFWAPGPRILILWGPQGP